MEMRTGRYLNFGTGHCGMADPMFWLFKNKRNDHRVQQNKKRNVAEVSGEIYGELDKVVGVRNEDQRSPRRSGTDKEQSDGDENKSTDHEMKAASTTATTLSKGEVVPDIEGDPNLPPWNGFGFELYRSVAQKCRYPNTTIVLASVDPETLPAILARTGFFPSMLIETETEAFLRKNPHLDARILTEAQEVHFGQKDRFEGYTRPEVAAIEAEVDTLMPARGLHPNATLVYGDRSPSLLQDRDEVEEVIENLGGREAFWEWDRAVAERSWSDHFQEGEDLLAENNSIIVLGDHSTKVDGRSTRTGATLLDAQHQARSTSTTASAVDSGEESFFFDETTSSTPSTEQERSRTTADSTATSTSALVVQHDAQRGETSPRREQSPEEHLPPPTSPGPDIELVVLDLDGYDYQILETLVASRQTVLVYRVEVAQHFPPPYKYAMLYHETKVDLYRDHMRYDKDMYFSPLYGMSLSAALNLLKDTHFLLYLEGKTDAIFVHKKLRKYVEKAFDVKLPVDEFLCYRASHLWHQMNQLYVRAWAFNEPVYEGLQHIHDNVTHFSPVPIEEGNVPFMLWV
ncbi:unnamed protein product [Amoebophrya sp. A25]|nr:unnamed protein product [Amoebophrya sp. A25]|eukprot:GSA25T00025997001.1